MVDLSSVICMKPIQCFCVFFFNNRVESFMGRGETVVLLFSHEPSATYPHFGVLFDYLVSCGIIKSLLWKHNLHNISIT